MLDDYNIIGHFQQIHNYILKTVQERCIVQSDKEKVECAKPNGYIANLPVTVGDP